MKIMKRELQYVDVVEDFICNKCSKSCKTSSSEDTPSFDGLLEVKAIGGYNSQLIGDMRVLKFSLCESCLIELVSTFEIPAESSEAIFL